MAPHTGRPGRPDPSHWLYQWDPAIPTTILFGYTDGIGHSNPRDLKSPDFFTYDHTEPLSARISYLIGYTDGIGHSNLGTWSRPTSSPTIIPNLCRRAFCILLPGVIRRWRLAWDVDLDLPFGLEVARLLCPRVYRTSVGAFSSIQYYWVSSSVQNT